MSAKKRRGQPAPRWREFMLTAGKRIADGEVTRETASEEWAMMVARSIVKNGDGEAFLKAVRRGRGTQRQNLRYQLLREVERLMGDAVPRRRPASNIPDSLALKSPVRLELEEFST